MSTGTTDPSRAAMEYNVGRTAAHSGGLVPPRTDAGLSLQRSSEPLSTTALRVLAVLMGWWVNQVSPGCEPNIGVHVGGCPHRANRLPASLRQLSLTAFGGAGGSQLLQVSRALDELSGETIDFTLVVDGRRYMRQRSHLLSFRQGGELVPAPRGLRSSLVVAWDPLLLESLLEGHYQLVPYELVQGLNGQTAFRLWMEILIRPAVRWLRRPGDWRDFAVSGAEPHSLSLARLGLGGQRSDKAIGSIRDYVDRGNRLQDVFRLEVHERVGDGHNVRLILQQPRPSRARRGSSPPRTAGTAHEDGGHGNPGPKARQTRTSADHVDPDEDGFKNVDETRIPHDADSGGSSRAHRPDVDTLTRHWRRPPTPKQVREILDRIADRHGGRGEGWEWNAWHLREAIKKRTDPLSYLKLQDSLARSGAHRQRSHRPRSKGPEAARAIIDDLRDRFPGALAVERRE